MFRICYITKLSFIGSIVPGPLFSSYPVISTTFLPIVIEADKLGPGSLILLVGFTFMGAIKAKF